MARCVARSSIRRLEETLCGIGAQGTGGHEHLPHLSLMAQQLEFGTSGGSPRGGWLLRMLVHLVVLVLAGLMYVNTPSLPSSR